MADFHLMMEESTFPADVTTPDFSLGWNNPVFSNGVLHFKILPDSLGAESDSDESPPKSKRHRSNAQVLITNEESATADDKAAIVIKADRVENEVQLNTGTLHDDSLHINNLVLAEKSEYFKRLFTNGMIESNQNHVTLKIHLSEREAVTHLLYYMFTNKLKQTSVTELFRVFIAADKYGVPTCMSYISRCLLTIPMDLETALIGCDPPEMVVDKVTEFVNISRNFIVSHFKNLDSSSEEFLDLPLPCVKLVLGSSDLIVQSETNIFGAALKWSRRNCPGLTERRQLLSTHLLPLVKFHYIPPHTLRKIVDCADILREEASRIVREALFVQYETPYGVMGRPYGRLPVKVALLGSPRLECIINLDLKQEDCSITGSDRFPFGGQPFILTGWCTAQETFGLQLACMGKVPFDMMIRFEFAARMKPGMVFVTKFRGNHRFTNGASYAGVLNLFGMPWTTFMDDNNPYAINKVIHLRIQLTVIED